MPIATPDTYVGRPGRPIYIGKEDPTTVGGTTLTSIYLVNDTLTEQAGGFVTPLFGHPFVQGDVPAGTWPQLETEDGVPVPYTHWGKTTWPDGSLKWLGFMARFPQAVPAMGSKPLRIKNGGAVPTAGARTISDVGVADINVLLNGVSNLSGEWVAGLNDAVAAAEDVVQFGSGAAGGLWRVGGHFKQAGTPHGQLYCWHYFAVLQNSSGGLAGIRYLGSPASPFGDVASPTPTRWTFSAELRTGSTVLRSLQGHDMTTTVSGTIGMPHHTRIFTAGTDAKWDFLQAGGSSAADCVVRVQHDKTYVVKSRLVPPYDTSLSPNSSPSRDYYPGGFGPMDPAVGGTGERNDIGVMTSWSARHLLTQAAVDERVVRVVGLASGGWRTLLKSSTTKQIIPVIDPSPSYAGLGTIQTTWRYVASGNIGFVPTVGNTTRWSSEDEPSHRPAATYYAYLITGEPQFLDMLVEQATSLISGAISGPVELNTTLPIKDTTIRLNGTYGQRSAVINGVTYKGAGYGFLGGLVRVQAWGLRDMAEAAAIYPDVCPAGTEVRKYLRDVVLATYTALNAYNTALGEEWNSSGIYNFDVRLFSFNMWCNGYMSNSVCHQYSILGFSEIATFRNFLGRLYENITQSMDLSAAFAYNGSVYDFATKNRTTSASDIIFSTNTHLVFSSSTNRFTVAAINGKPGGWSPTNGDVIVFPGPEDSEADYTDKPFAGVVDWKHYYVVNASGNTGQLAETPNGAAITFTNDVTLGPKFYARVQNLSPVLGWEGTPSNEGYFASISSAVLHHAATGDPGVPTALASAVAKRAASGLTFVADPKNALLANYPS